MNKQNEINSKVVERIYLVSGNFFIEQKKMKSLNGNSCRLKFK